LISIIIYLVAVKDNHTNAETQEKLSQGISDLKEMAKCYGFGSEASRPFDIWHIVGALKFSLPCKQPRLEKLISPYLDITRPILPKYQYFEMQQSTDPILSSMNHPLFLPFPMQGLLSVILGTQLERKALWQTCGLN
jgi:hypothetical protein